MSNIATSLGYEQLKVPVNQQTQFTSMKNIRNLSIIIDRVTLNSPAEMTDRGRPEGSAATLLRA